MQTPPFFLTPLATVFVALPGFLFAPNTYAQGSLNSPHIHESPYATPLNPVIPNPPVPPVGADKKSPEPAPAVPAPKKDETPNGKLPTTSSVLADAQTYFDTPLQSLRTKEGRWWGKLTFAPGQFTQNGPYLCTSLQSGAGVGFLIPQTFGPCWRVSFEVIEPNESTPAQVRMLATPLEFSASTPAQERQAQQNYPRSILAQIPATAKWDPSERTVLFDLAALVGSTDLASWSTSIERSTRTSYAYEPRTSRIQTVIAKPDQLAIVHQAHFIMPRLAATPSGAYPPSADPRSLLIDQGFVFYKEDPAFESKPQHPNLGFFGNSQEVGADTSLLTRRDFISKWNLQLEPVDMKDWPADKPAPMFSQAFRARTPIVVAMDPSIPERWYPAMLSGVQMWQRAFERAGILNAISIVPLNTAEAITSRFTVMWYRGASAGAAYGPSRMHRQTGEILQAYVYMPDAFAVSSFNTPRLNALSAPIAPFAPVQNPSLNSKLPSSAHTNHSEHPGQPHNDSCDVAQDLTELASSQILDMDPEFANAFIAMIAGHEVGHALGLRHNFKGSAASANLLLAKGSSLMDYYPFPKNTQDIMTAPGAYDELALAYAYLPKPLMSQVDAAIAKARLPFASDSEIRPYLGPDRLAGLRDNGPEPLLAAQQHLDAISSVWRSWERQSPEPWRLRAQLSYQFGSIVNYIELASRHLVGYDSQWSARDPFYQNYLQSASPSPAPQTPTSVPIPAVRPLASSHYTQATELLTRVLDPAFFAPASVFSSAAPRTLEITNPDKVLRPEASIRSALLNLTSALYSTEFVERQSALARQYPGAYTPLRVEQEFSSVVWLGTPSPARLALQEDQIKLFSVLLAVPVPSAAYTFALSSAKSVRTHLQTYLYKAPPSLIKKLGAQRAQTVWIGELAHRQALLHALTEILEVRR